MGCFDFACRNCGIDSEQQWMGTKAIVLFKTKTGVAHWAWGVYDGYGVVEVPNSGAGEDKNAYFYLVEFEQYWHHWKNVHDDDVVAMGAICWECAEDFNSDTLTTLGDEPGQTSISQLRTVKEHKSDYSNPIGSQNGSNVQPVPA